MVIQKEYSETKDNCSEIDIAVLKRSSRDSIEFHIGGQTSCVE